MEKTIATFTKSLGTFCNHLQTSCDALRQSVDRRPIPLDSASSTFIQSLNRRVDVAITELNFLETMSFDTVSLEELLGHCNEVYKSNEASLIVLADRLSSCFGYVPPPSLEIEVDDEDEASNLDATLSFYSKRGSGVTSSQTESIRGVYSTMKSLDNEDHLMDETFSLKSMGLSETCLATLASEANSKIDSPDISLTKYYGSEVHSIEHLDCNARKTNVEIDANTGRTECDKTAEAACSVIEVSQEDYENLPSYMKSLTSWQDLLVAVEKINSGLQRGNTKGRNYFHQDEISSLDLGPKARSYLLLLMKMNQLAVETIDGSISYKVL